MTERIIQTTADLDEGMAYLIGIEPRFSVIDTTYDPLPLRLRGDGFPAILSAILGQQISVAAAAGIWARLQAADAVTEEGVRQYDEAGLRALGLTRQKAGYIHGIAQARVDYMALRTLPTSDVIRDLTALKGIGPWTAEIYTMFSLGRIDVMPAGDLAIQEAARVLFDLPTRPDAKQMRSMAAPWTPWRSVAARALWHYYKHLKSREGIG